jgi:hypothetical protein
LHLQTLPGGKEQGEQEHKEADQTLPKPPTPLAGRFFTFKNF